MTASVDLLANNGTVGGGEVMMVALAEAARQLGVEVRVVAPAEPGETVRLAREQNLEVLVIDARDRLGYLRGLATRRANLDGDLWWCNGLVPALATAGSRHRRVVQLHQAPEGVQRHLWKVARRGAERVFVPSWSMNTRVPGSVVLENWTGDLAMLGPVVPDESGPYRVGFIGRFSPIKGLDVLARAVQRLDDVLDRPLELVLAGDGRFVSDSDTALVERSLAGVRHVHRLGWVRRDQFFSSVDLAVVPSVWAEPFGLVVAEAMAYGRPVVISDAGALGEVVGPEHPWVARAGDMTDTARVIRHVCELPGDDLDQWVRQARMRWETEFSPGAGRVRVARELERLGLIEGDGSAEASV